MRAISFMEAPSRRAQAAERCGAYRAHATFRGIYSDCRSCPLNLIPLRHLWRQHPPRASYRPPQAKRGGGIAGHPALSRNRCLTKTEDPIRAAQETWAAQVAVLRDLATPWPHEAGPVEQQ